VVIVALGIAVLVLLVYAALLRMRLRGAEREAERLQRAVARHAETLRAARSPEGAVLDHLPDPLIVLDAARSVRRTNAAARAAFGADLGAVLRHPDLRAAIDRALISGRRQEVDLFLPVPVPREVHAAVVLLEAPLDDGGRVLLVLSDRP
jgi:two-component system, OmpR family, phosphate regulon sensor histidine kinase PhoR